MELVRRAMKQESGRHQPLRLQLPLGESGGIMRKGAVAQEGSRKSTQGRPHPL